MEEKRAEQKVASNEIVDASSEEREKLLNKMKKLKAELEIEEYSLKKVIIVYASFNRISS